MLSPLPTDSSLIASSAYRVVAGLGITGLSVLRFLQARGIRCVAVDSRSEPPGLAAAMAAWPELPIFCGEVPAHLLAAAEAIIVSPGLALEDPLLAPARSAEVRLSSDIELFLEAAGAPVIGITGSNAKSTVTSLVGAMAQAAGRRVAVGGNLGTPALDLLDDANDLYVLELSSFQLERLARAGLAVAAMLNLSPDHIDRHGSVMLYHRAKQRVFMGCSAAVYNRDDALTQPLLPVEVARFSFGLGEPDLNQFGLRTADGITWLCRGHERLLPAAELPLAGRHGCANALAALAVGTAAGLPLAPMLVALRGFTGLPHRCTVLEPVRGVRYVDDSKGTNPGATLAALAGLGGHRDVLLIAGGQGKGADFGALVPAVAQHCKAVLLIGEAAPALAALFATVTHVERCDSLDAAVRRAQALADNGDLVLLSPACASFDMFQSYADRGLQFQVIAAMLRGAP